jgi:hypothetical protein
MGDSPEPKRVIADDIWAQIWPGGIDEGWPAFTEYADELRRTDSNQFPDLLTLIAAGTPTADPQRPDPRYPEGNNIIRVVFGERVIAPTWLRRCLELAVPPRVVAPGARGDAAHTVVDRCSGLSCGLGWSRCCRPSTAREGRAGSPAISRLWRLAPISASRR